ncbi:MAG: TIGR00730 family Rossman fold protein [Gammaproteobacteria bacterium]|nr:TIGR00730 family Rossman fold protein [Gammaproteobacteria bacterium]
MSAANDGRRAAVCVFCGSRAGQDPAFLRSARDTGRLLAERGLTLVYGGGGRGMMGAVADAALAAGGRVIGVIPRDLFAREHLHAGLDEVHEVTDLLARKRLMAELSDGFMVLPGGLGTLDELFEMWTWQQLKMHAKPCAVVNVSGYFDPLLRFSETLVQSGFLEPAARDLLLVEAGPEPALRRLLDWRPLPPV